MGRKILLVDVRALADLLRIDQRDPAAARLWLEGLPVDARIIGVLDDLFFTHRSLGLVVESDEFPDPPDGCELYRFELTVHELPPTPWQPGRKFL